jgi:hypothetical protein
MEKSSPKFWDTIVILKMPKEIDRPIGEKSPNLATLVRRSFFFSF